MKQVLLPPSRMTNPRLFLPPLPYFHIFVLHHRKYTNSHFVFRELHNLEVIYNFQMSKMTSGLYNLKRVK